MSGNNTHSKTLLYKPSASASFSDQISGSRDRLLFFFGSTNEIVAYHRRVLFSAIIPLFYAAALLTAQHLKYYETTFSGRAAHFLVGLSFCYATFIIKCKLLPREKTYGTWSEYMLSVRHNRHVWAVLQAYTMQLKHGDAPAETSPLCERISTETYKLWSTKITGLTPSEVRTKYVNFCWRYTFRLWSNKLQLTSTNRAEHATGPEVATVSSQESTFSDARPVERQVGDSITPRDDLRRILHPSEQVKLQVLEQLAGKISRFAEVLQDKSECEQTARQSEHHRGDDRILSKMKEEISQSFKSHLS